MSNIDLETLIQESIRGNRKAQHALYMGVAPALMRLCKRYTKSEDQAKDYLQDAFIKIFTNLHELKESRVFEGWAKRILIHTILQDFRKRQPLKDSFEIEDQIHLRVPDADAISSISYSELLDFVNMLPEGRKLVFNMAVIDGYNHKEIGELLNITESTSRVQLHKAKETLVEIHKKYNQSKLLNV